MSLDEKQLLTIAAYDRSAAAYEGTIARLPNYDRTYDFLAGMMRDGQTVIDLACGPANISRYLLRTLDLKVIGYDLSGEMLRLAQAAVPNGTFLRASITDFSPGVEADVVINGFGLPYLDAGQADSCIRSAHRALRHGGLLYLSFMQGEGRRLESPSFSPAENILVHYHRKEDITAALERTGFVLLESWEIDYTEQDGSITKDVVLLAQKP